ncbi:MAG: hypothetical protein Q8J78_16030 [Moraxellaceae bacterium]|nr:hypothetical protein [Moraxellaceae bacterium]
MTAPESSLSNSDIIAISAVVIAALAFIATMWQGFLARQHNRLSVRPLIDFDFNKSPDTNISISIKNLGVGAAIIKSIHIISNEKTEYLNVDAITRLAKSYRMSFPKTIVAMIEPDSAIAAGQHITLIEFVDTASESQFRSNVERLLADSRIHVKYECLYKNTYGATVVCS